MDPLIIENDLPSTPVDVNNLNTFIKKKKKKIFFF